jgi:hypothetical protein
MVDSRGCNRRQCIQLLHKLVEEDLCNSGYDSDPPAPAQHPIQTSTLNHNQHPM